MAATKVQRKLYPILASEVGLVTNANSDYPYGDVRRFGAVGDGVSDDTSAVQNALASFAGSVALQFAQGKTYRLNALTVAVDDAVIDIPKGTILQFATQGVSTNAFTVTASNVTFRGLGKILGPNAGVYTQDERGISMVGASSASRKTGLRIDGPEITGFGAHGVYCQFVDRIDIPSAYLHDNGYAGGMFLSCDHGRIGAGVRVETITPGTGGNMYGISLTHDSTNYSSDPNAGTQQAANPFCSDWIIDGAFINDINWEGLDCHGGYDIAFINNKIFNTKHGLSIPTGSGAASNYAGWKNRAQGNTIDARKPDGTASGRENVSYGINVDGGSTTPNSQVIVADNILVNKGVVSSATLGAIIGEYTKGAQFHHNILRAWGGVGVYLGAFSDDAIVAHNIFQELANGADTSGIAIRHTGTTQRLTVSGNVLTANGGTAGRVGLDIVNMTARPQLDGNNFKAATVAEYQFKTSPGQVNGTAAPVVVQMTSASSSIDVSSAAAGSEIIIEVVVSSGAFTLDTITGAKPGQVITIVNIGSSTVTLSRSSSALLGSATAVIPTKGTVRLVRVASTNYEISRSLTNG